MKLFILIVFLSFQCCIKSSGLKKPPEPDVDLTTDYENNYKFDLQAIPGVGDPIEEVYSKMGIPTRRYSFNPLQTFHFGKKEISFDKLCFYESSSTIHYGGQGYSRFENVESIIVSIFFRDGIIQEVVIRHMVRAPNERIWKMGKYDSKHGEFQSNSYFPNSKEIFAEYWRQKGRSW
jgi:hypothetical protein